MTREGFLHDAQGLVLQIRLSLDSIQPPGPAPPVTEDLRALLRALHFALERYREAIAIETGDRRS